MHTYLKNKCQLFEDEFSLQKPAQASAICSLSIIPLSHFRSIMVPGLCRSLLTEQNNRWENSDELFQITERREKQIWWIWFCSPLKKTTNGFVTGIQLVGDTFYPNGLTLNCIQSAGIKTLFDPADVSWQDIGLKVMKVVSLKLVSQVWSIPLLIISTTLTFLLKHSLTFMGNWLPPPPPFTLTKHGTRHSCPIKYEKMKSTFFYFIYYLT